MAEFEGLESEPPDFGVIQVERSESRDRYEQGSLRRLGRGEPENIVDAARGFSGATRRRGKSNSGGAYHVEKPVDFTLELMTLLREGAGRGEHLR